MCTAVKKIIYLVHINSDSGLSYHVLGHMSIHLYGHCFLQHIRHLIETMKANNDSCVDSKKFRHSTKILHRVKM